MKKVNLLKSTKLFSLVILLYIISSINSCTVYCPAFSEEYKNWFPYYEMQELCFIDLNDTIYCWVNDYESSEEYSYNERCGCECDSWLHFNLYTDSTEDFYVYSKIQGYHIDTIPTIPKMSFIFKLKDYFVFKEDEDWQYYDSLAIQGIYYNDVLVIQNKNIEEAKEYTEMKVVKGYGLFEFSDIDGNTWVLETE